MTLIAQGPTEVSRFQIIVVKNAIKLYRDTGIKANRAYTPTNMRRTAEHLTGKTFKARDWDGMIAALEEKLNPPCEHDWVEGVEDHEGEIILAEPAYDICINCGERRD